MKPHVTEVNPEEDGSNRVLIHPASRESVDFVLSQRINEDKPGGDDDRGRSPWMWVRLPNGDLILGTYPQGDTYFCVEIDAQFPGE